LTVSQRAYDGGNTSGERTVSTALNAHGSRIDFDTETFVVRSVEDDSADSADPMEPRGCRLVTQAVTCSFGGGGPDDNKAQAGFYVVVQEDGNVSPDTDSPEQHFVVGSTAPPVTTHPYNDNISRESGLIVTAFNGAQDPAVYDAVSGPCGRNQGQETCIAFTERSRNGGRNLEMQDNLAYALQNPASGGGTHSRRIATRSAVRRLTPRECERLQGFPDDYTLIPYARRAPKTIDDERIDYLLRGGRATYDECLRAVKDSPRYKTIGNSKAVNVIRWILLRIERFHFQQQRSCPVWCPCSADNMPIRHGSEICFNIQMRYAAEYRSETPVKKKYKVSVM
jgi:DNA (cytosine-5)-methyltransferase 1